MTQPTAGPATDSQIREEVLIRVRSLPPFSPVASQVLRLSSPRGEVLELDEIARIIDSDPALTAEMLQMANSPLLGLQCTIHSIRHAIIVLGFERTKALAIRTAMQIYMKGAFEHPVLGRCWLHSLACAEIAKAMAISWGQVGGDSAYTAALLHDIGRLALVKPFRAEYLPLLGPSRDSADEIIAAEVQSFGFDHCQAGHELCILWNFPKAIGEIALCHHEPLSGQHNSLLNIVRISCRMAASLGFAAVRYEKIPSCDELQSALPNPLRQRFEYSAKQLRQMIVERVGSMPQ